MWMDATKVAKIGLPGFGSLLCPSLRDQSLGEKRTIDCLTRGYNYKYDDGNPNGEPSMMKKTLASFKGWSAFFHLPDGAK